MSKENSKPGFDSRGVRPTNDKRVQSKQDCYFVQQLKERGRSVGNEIRGMFRSFGAIVPREPRRNT